MRKTLTIGARWLCLAALLAPAAGCKDPPEAPPVRLQSLRSAKWDDGPHTVDPVGAIDDAAAKELTPTPIPEPTPRYKGVLWEVLTVWEETGHQGRRQRALEQGFEHMTEQDVEEAYRALQGGRRMDAEVAIALLTLNYTSKQDWRLLEDAYRQLFRAVPELASDPAYLLEHAVALLKLEEYRASLDEARTAETYFRALPAGQRTLEHRARLAECRAWASEGLSRKSEAAGVSDAELRELDLLALRAWDSYITLLLQMPPSTPGLEERLTQSRDHRTYLRESLEISGGAP